MGVFPSGLSSRRKQSGSSGYTHRCHQPDNVTDAFTALQPRDNGCHQADEPVFRKKEKKCCSLAGCPFCHSVTGICPHGGRSAPISRTRNIILSLPAAPFLGVPCVYRYHFEILRYAKALKPPEKTPPEAIIESLCIVSTKCGNDTQITVLQ